MQPQTQQRKGELFLIDERQEFKIKDKLMKVFGFSPMFNNTFVVLGKKQNRDQGAIHYDATGKILNEKLKHKASFYGHVIPSEEEIIWIHDEEDKLLQWNLRTGYYIEFDHKYEHDAADTHQLFYYPDTKLVCVAEWGGYDSNFLRFTYYDYPLKQESKPVYVWGTEKQEKEPKQNQPTWTYDYTIRRANNHSMFMWVKSSLKQKIELRVFDLVKKEDGYEGRFKVLTTANGYKAGNNPCQLSVKGFWEMKPRKYIIISITDRPHQNDDDFPNSIFVYEEDNNVFRQSNICLDGKFRYQCLHQCSFGRNAMIRSFDFIKGVVQETPIYYLDNQNELIVAKQTWKCSYLHKYIIPGYDGNMMIDAQFENGDVDWIKSRKVKVADFRQLIADLMVESIPEVDTNLIEQSLNLILARGQ